MSSLFPEVDEEATINNVKQLLSNYHHFRALAHRPIGQLKSTVISDMPRDDSYGNRIEDDYVNGFSAQQIEVNCRHAIESIENDEYRIILHDKYIGMGKTDQAIMMDLNLAKKTYYRHAKRAYLTFAEVYGIQELREFKTEEL